MKRLFIFLFFGGNQSQAADNQLPLFERQDAITSFQEITWAMERIKIAINRVEPFNVINPIDLAILRRNSVSPGLDFFSVKNKKSSEFHNVVLAQEAITQKSWRAFFQLIGINAPKNAIDAGVVMITDLSLFNSYLQEDPHGEWLKQTPVPRFVTDRVFAAKQLLLPAPYAFQEGTLR